jgi:hypothetical protein
MQVESMFEYLYKLLGWRRHLINCDDCVSMEEILDLKLRANKSNCVSRNSLISIFVEKKLESKLVYIY